MVQVNKMKPGFQDEKEYESINKKRLSKYIEKFIIPFIKVKKYNTCADIGCANFKSQYIGDKLGLTINQLNSKDFNFDVIKTDKKYDTIFAFEIVEHLQNPLWFMCQLKSILKDNGSLYVSIPNNIVWHDFHFFEIGKKHFDKWLVVPAGLKIVKHKKIIYLHNLKGIFIGFRPFIRLLRGKEKLKHLLTTRIVLIGDIYEIKKDC